MSTKSKSARAKELAGPLLTRDDIAALLVAYYGALMLDRAHAHDFCRKCSDRKRKEMCEDGRNGHLRQIYLLLNTLTHISEETLEKLTVLAATRKPIAVRKVLRGLLEDGAYAPLAGEHMWTAPELFSALVKEVDQGARAPTDGEDTVARMMRWLDLVDPLRTSRECGYKDIMSPQIWR
jgi:hypothetical protein